MKKLTKEDVRDLKYVLSICESAKAGDAGPHSMEMAANKLRTIIERVDVEAMAAKMAQDRRS